MTTEITVVKECTFDAAHHLPGYNGPCARQHGHTYRLQIGVTGPIDPETGMVADFKYLGYVLDDIASRVDHRDLNEVTDFGFPCRNPTAENMLGWICTMFDKFKGNMRTANLSFVRLWETPTSYAEWRAK